jgi:hypothetical protein
MNHNPIIGIVRPIPYLTKIVWYVSSIAMLSAGVCVQVIFLLNVTLWLLLRLFRFQIILIPPHNLPVPLTSFYLHLVR